VAVGRGTAVAREVLKNRKNAAGHQTLSEGPSEDGHLSRFIAVRTVTDYGIGAGGRHVRDGRAIDVNPELRQVIRNKLPPQPRGGKATGRIAVE
jgi:hypothetical protein